jgi:hypothetical protein
VEANPYIERSFNKYKFHSIQKADATDATYELLEMIYGVDRNWITNCEDIITKVPSIPVRINSHLFSPFFEVDIAKRDSDSTSEHIPPPKPPSVVCFAYTNPIEAVCEIKRWIGIGYSRCKNLIKSYYRRVKLNLIPPSLPQKVVKSIVIPTVERVLPAATHLYQTLLPGTIWTNINAGAIGVLIFALIRTITMKSAHNAVIVSHYQYFIFACKNFGRQLAITALATLVYAPFVEEAVKHFGRLAYRANFDWIGALACCAIILWETFNYHRHAMISAPVLGLPFPTLLQSISVYAPTALMHVAACIAPYKGAVALHFFYNVVALNSQILSMLNGALGPIIKMCNELPPETAAAYRAEYLKLTGILLPGCTLNGVMCFYSHTKQVELAMARTPRTAQMMLDKMVENRTLSETGKAWLIQTTDPFHDSNIPTTGYPDMNSCQTITQCFAKTSTLTTPTPTTTALWDAHVFFNPTTFSWNGNIEASRMTWAPNGALAASSNGTLLVSGYNALSMPSGADWVNDTAPGAIAVTTLNYPYSAATGQTRLVACGVEIVNTTPQLYRGGSVTVFRSPTSISTGMYSSPATGSAIVPIVTASLPPSTQAQAQIYPQSKTWGAEEGCYIVGTMSEVENRFKMITPNAILVTQPFSLGNLQNNTSVYTFGQVAELTSTTPDARSAQQLVPFDNHGAIFTGLQQQTTLQITVKYFVERIPTYNQPDLLVLVRPPSTYDPVALEIYTRCIESLPVGVMVKENPLGEWFNDVLQAVADYAPSVGSIFGPIGGTLGQAAATAARASLKQRKRKPAQSGGSVTTQSIYNQAPRRQPNGRGRTKTRAKRQRQKKGNNNFKLLGPSS